LVVRGSLPLWLGFCINTVLAYFSFAPVHEAIHGNISGRDGTPGQAPWVDSVFGWMWSVMQITPFSAYRRLHLRHHAHTNHPDSCALYPLDEATWGEAVEHR
jgi:beta-carotene hydroxylase